MELKPMTKDQAVEIKNSTAWSYINNEIEYRISLKVNQLRTCTPQDLLLLQKELTLLEEFHRLLDDVADRESDTGSVAR